MKKVLIILIILTNTSFALNFKESVEEYSKNNPGKTENIYILNRCGGVLNYAGSKLIKENAETAADFINSSAVALQYSAMLYSKHSDVDINKAININMERIKKLEKKYREDGKENFLNNGRYFVGILGDDMFYCKRLISVLNNNG